MSIGNLYHTKYTNIASTVPQIFGYITYWRSLNNSAKLKIKILEVCRIHGILAKKIEVQILRGMQRFKQTYVNQEILNFLCHTSTQT